MKKTQITCLLGIAASLLVPMTSANAHFLWGSVTPGAEPTFRLSISETPEDVNDLEHIKEAEESAAWAVGGRDLRLTTKGGAREGKYSPTAKVLAAGFSWGVFPTPDTTPRVSHLLDLYAKAAVTEAAAAESANLPLEVFAKREGKDFVATVKAENKPLAKADVVVVTPGETAGKTFKTDDNGNVSFQFTKPGLYTVRAIEVRTPRTGYHNGKYYTSVLGFSTLTFTAAQ